MACEICKGKGFLIKREEGKEDVAIPCRCRIKFDKEVAVKIRLIKADIPKTHWDISVEGFKNLKFEENDFFEKNTESITTLEKLITTAKDIKKYPRVIWIWGTKLHPNSCHTTLAVLIGIACMKINVSVRFISMQSLLNAFINFEEKESFFKEFNKHKVFIIDDAFDESRCIVSGNYTQIHLFNWFNDAMNARKILICTSNTLLKDVDAIYEQSKIILSRDAQELEIVGSFSPVDIKNFLLKEG